MIKIQVSSSNPDKFFTLNGLDYEKGIYSIFYANVIEDVNNNILEDKVKVGIIDKDNNIVLQYPVHIYNYINASDVKYETLNGLLTDLIPLIVQPNSNGTSVQNLQEVTDIGATTTNNITANSFTKTGATSVDFLKGDGSIDSIVKWNTIGNSGTNPTTDFIGTTDDVDFVLRRNNKKTLEITADISSQSLNVLSLSGTKSTTIKQDESFCTFTTIDRVDECFGNYYFRVNGSNTEGFRVLSTGQFIVLNEMIVVDTALFSQPFLMSPILISAANNSLRNTGDDLIYKDNVGVEQQVLTNHYTGWGDYTDTQYTTGSPFLVTSGMPSQALPNNALSKNETQKPIDVTSFYDGTVITGRNGDSISITIEFKARPTMVASDIRLKTSIDIGGAIGEIYPREFFLSKGSGVEHFYLTTTTAYTLDTWETNGGTVKIESFNSNVEVYDIRYVITRTHKAR